MMLTQVQELRELREGLLRARSQAKDAQAHAALVRRTVRACERLNELEERFGGRHS